MLGSLRLPTSLATINFISMFCAWPIEVGASEAILAQSQAFCLQFRGRTRNCCNVRAPLLRLLPIRASSSKVATRGGDSQFPSKSHQCGVGWKGRGPITNTSFENVWNLLQSIEIYRTSGEICRTSIAHPSKSIGFYRNASKPIKTYGNSSRYIEHL